MYIEIKNARKTYGNGETAVNALDNISINLDQGKIYVVLGPSGSGKSTFLNMLGGLDHLDEGHILVDGVEIGQMNKAQLSEYRRKDIGFVFQFYNLIPDLTVEENIKVVSEIADHPLDLEDVLKTLEMEKYRFRFPRELSGGQQQRASIARAMVKNPKLLLCDELTGALDTKTSRAVLKFVQEVNRRYGTTIVIITHNEAIAQMADGIVKIRDGKIEEFTRNEDKVNPDELIL